MSYLVDFYRIAQLVALQPDGLEHLFAGTSVSQFLAKSINLRLQRLFGQVVFVFSQRLINFPDIQLVSRRLGKCQQQQKLGT